MLICDECNKTFDESDVYHWEERHGFNHGPFEKWSGSPCCHESYSDARVCESCGEYYHPDDMSLNDECEHLCPDCAYDKQHEAGEVEGK